MAEPTSALSTQELVLTVAEYYGVASYDSDGLPYIPADDAFNLRECTRLVNEAIRMFIARPPRRTGKWRWMHRTQTVTFDADGTGDDNISTDAARYMLSTDFNGQIAGPIWYIAESGHGISIQWCDVSEIVAGREVDIADGYPTRAAIRPYTPTGPSLGARRWEIIFNPSPSSAESVQFPYIAGFDKLVLAGGTATGASATTVVDSTRIEPDDYFVGWTATIISGTGKGSYATVTDYAKATGTITVANWLDIEGGAAGTDPVTGSIYALEPAANLHPCGIQFDEAVRTACLAKCEMEADDSELGTRYIEYFEKIALPSAHSIDTNSAPRTLGKMRGGGSGVYERTREDVTFTE